MCHAVQSWGSRGAQKQHTTCYSTKFRMNVFRMFIIQFIKNVFVVCRAEYRQAMMSMSSTLVETVSIDYEDFNESFLTCGTCLCKCLKCLTKKEFVDFHVLFLYFCMFRHVRRHRTHPQADAMLTHGVPSLPGPDSGHICPRHGPVPVSNLSRAHHNPSRGSQGTPALLSCQPAP